MARALQLGEGVVRHLLQDDAVPDCGRDLEEVCFDKDAAVQVKVAAIAVIFLTSAVGVLIPLLGRRLGVLSPDRNPFFIMKVFAAGVILATAFIHMLPTAMEVLANPCLPTEPWGHFAWSGFIAMLGALGTLVIEFGATEFYLNRHGWAMPGPIVDTLGEINTLEKQSLEASSGSPTCIHVKDGRDESMFTHARHLVVAQVFEFGVVAHSIIVGITVGVSHSPCTIKPLFAALTFHQFFEGIALGGCITLAGFRTRTSLIMGTCFAITTPLGIAIGMGIANTYNEKSPKSLMVTGIFDSISAGILLYMALVDLIASDFYSKRIRGSRILATQAFLALFLGVACMSIIGVWA
ncbi:hypothetical protein M758_2G097800 [Ceratodon purpureus]|nr:hypothetical protein M758_2G097800 [Ceratodon purpureus]KAG0626034.1 hypothetical protein M758_2G097800 [Ceratodon purpureus]KAG0626035.1 hypothetical protein M758_2G097800 [Ceratodon purpureus]